MRMWPILALAAACSGTVVQPGGAIDPPDAGAAATAACEVPPMDQIYSGVYPPNPWAPALVAAPCMTQPHDAIVVLGCPSNADGGASDGRIGRTRIGPRLFRRGCAAKGVPRGP